MNLGNDKGNAILQQSIQELGAGRSILVDKNGFIIAGNKTAQAALNEGLDDAIIVETAGDKLVVVQRTDLDLSTDPRAKQLAIADNRVAEINLEWDTEALKELATEIDLSWLEIDNSFIEELEKIAEANNAEELEREEGLTDEDEVPDDADVETRVKKGDVWQLGRHRVMCGDSTVITDVDKLMDGKKTDMVFTDPPYGMNLDTDYSKLPSTKEEGNKKFDRIIGDDKPFDPRFILSTFDDCSEVIMFGADYYATHLPVGSWFVWDKRCDEKFDRMIGSGFELAWSKTKHKREIARFNNTLFSGESEARNKVHPTQKPVKMIEWFFERLKGNCVVDLFLGSGSTLIACEKTGRTCYGMELSEKYCDVILKRWEDFTGKTAVLVKD